MKYSCDGQDGHLWIFCLRSTFDIVYIGEPVFNPASCSVNTLWYLWQIYFNDCELESGCSHLISDIALIPGKELISWPLEHPCKRASFSCFHVHWNCRTVNNDHINPFHATCLFLYPLKTDVFKGYRKDRWYEMA